MTYRIKARRLDQARYELSYGRGSKRLTDTALAGHGRSWHIIGRDDLGTAPTLGRIRRRWGEWAKHVYPLHPDTRPDPEDLILTAPPAVSKPRRVSQNPRRASINRTQMDVSDAVGRAERDALLQGAI